VLINIHKSINKLERSLGLVQIGNMKKNTFNKITYVNVQKGKPVFCMNHNAQKSEQVLICSYLRFHTIISPNKCMFSGGQPVMGRSMIITQSCTTVPGPLPGTDRIRDQLSMRTISFGKNADFFSVACTAP
jgi:hypothetical protein